MHNILLVEDNEEIYLLVNQALSSFTNLVWSSSVEDAKKRLSDFDFSLLLLDVELPDGSGIDLCTNVLAANPKTSVFFLTSHTQLSEKVLGFSAGADDYITKPFMPLELRARVEAKLKKLEAQANSAERLKWREIEIDKNRQEVNVRVEGSFKKVELTALEFKLLTYFANNPGQVFPRDQVLNDIWGEDVHVYPRSVDTHVSKLRKKLGPVAGIIESVHGTGYKFSASTL